MSSIIYWAGDSTVKTNDHTTYPQTGIGQGIGLYLAKDVLVKNHAENGRSTKSFIDESRLAAIYNDLREGDFLFIQFGHNDSKSKDPERYTEPFGTYQENLEKFVNVARNRKAHPVFISSICRRWFLEDGSLDPDKMHGDYPAAMKALAEQLEVPYIDLTASSKKLLESWGAKASESHFMNLEAGMYPNYPEGQVDNTHLTYSGAVAFAALVAKGLKDLGGIYSELISNTVK